LLEAEASRKTFERGFRSKLAEKAGCQSGYVTQVLNGQAHFSLEQGLKVANFLGLKEREQKCFLLLVEIARAGTKELEAYFRDELRALREEHLNIKKRVGDSHSLSEHDQSIYYSSWHYLAVHVLSSLPEYNDAKSIANALKVPDEVVNGVLLFLSQVGIIEEKKGILKPGLTQVHLNRESPLIRQHHTNWRIAAIQSLMNDSKTDVHYSTVSTLSKVDAEKLRAQMVKLIENYVETVKPSPEEVMYGFNLDFYSLVKN
ncbi:MAG TPA: TIGR02147 family protein, partial [Bdellovibrionales bacterium]|nr:TIGR02147 family protein [Bdellovibrionales bacterium]